MNESTLDSLNILNFSEADYNSACEKVIESYNGSQCCGVASIRTDYKTICEIYQYHFDTKTFNKIKISDSIQTDNGFEKLKEDSYIKYIVLYNESEDSYYVLYNARIEFVSTVSGSIDVVAPFDIMIKCNSLHQASVIIDSNAIENSINENMENILTESECDFDGQEIETEEEPEGTTPYDACDELTEDWLINC